MSETTGTAGNLKKNMPKILPGPQKSFLKTLKNKARRIFSPRLTPFTPEPLSTSKENGIYYENPLLRTRRSQRRRRSTRRN